MKDEIAGLGHLFVSVFIYNLSVFIVIPAITDITMSAVCPGTDQCSLAIYLSGFQQAITGIGALLVTPIIGNLSDKHGRKALLTFCVIISTLPMCVLAYDRNRSFFYAYYILSTIAGMFSKGGIQCLTLAYVADKVPEQRRASAFGILTGVSAVGFVLGSLFARFTPISLTFQMSAMGTMITAVYLKIFLKDSLSGSKDDNHLTPLPQIASACDMIALLRSSGTFLHAATIAFLFSFGESGLQDSLLYYLKAAFHYSKDQYASFLLIVGVAAAFSQLVLMPVVVPSLGEEKLLSMALFANFVHIFLYSFAWNANVPYFAATFVIGSVFAHPCLRSIVSKTVGPGEQGMAQGCISGVACFANILAPLGITPLTAMFLSESAPFHFPGFSIFCVALMAMYAFVHSLIMRKSCQTSLSILIEKQKLDGSQVV